MRRNIYSDLFQHVDTDEELLWTGQPKIGIVFSLGDIFLIPFSLLWCGFAIFWVIMASSAGIFALFGIPFVIVSLFMVFGRFIHDAKVRANTAYGITKDRIIIKSGVFSKSIRSLNLKTLSDIEYSENPDGSGSINFGPKIPFYSTYSGMTWWPGIPESNSLLLIKNVRSVYKQIIDLQRDK